MFIFIYKILRICIKKNSLYGNLGIALPGFKCKIRVIIVPTPPDSLKGEQVSVCGAFKIALIT